jgi:hypothetical protein
LIKAKSRGGSAKSVTKRRSKEDDESDVEDVPRKKNKIERVVEYSKTLNELFLTKDVAGLLQIHIYFFNIIIIIKSAQMTQRIRY